jgi:hypothetical protein
MYLGVLLNSRGTVSEEINERITTGNKAYYANSQLLKSALLSRSTKLKLYRTAETWTLNISDEHALRIFERKIIRKIYGPVCEDDLWRVRSNSEINSLLQGGNIVRHAKFLRLSWLGHVDHMECERTSKCLLNGELFGVHRRGRPRKRWFQEVKDSLSRKRIGKWKEKAQERNAWRSTVKEAKGHQGL